MIATSPRKSGRALATTLALAGLLSAAGAAAAAADVPASAPTPADVAGRATPVDGARAPMPADVAIAGAERRVAVAASSDALVALASAFMRKARETGEPSYYARAAAAADRALAANPSDYIALRTRAWVLLGQHDFAGALRVARRARRLRPEDWWNYGTLADACMELGYYRGATHATARLAGLRPGLPAYARVAALRAVAGDRPGAIDALRLALAATDASDREQRAWVLTYLGHERWALGDVGRAAACYESAMAAFPDYHLALGGLARARAAEGRTADAIALYERALARSPSPSTAGALGDLYAETGNPDRARASYDFAVYMGRVANARGRTLGRELALFLADHDGDLNEALVLARAEATARDDVYTSDALAWVRFKRGELAAAKRAAARALRLGTEDAIFHRHFAAIATALGHPRAAARERALATALEPRTTAGARRTSCV